MFVGIISDRFQWMFEGRGSIPHLIGRNVEILGGENVKEGAVSNHGDVKWGMKGKNMG